MKKSELRNIIRESIKQLMNEQSWNVTMATYGCTHNINALSNLNPNPQLGDIGITQQFVNNMAGKPTGFYQKRRQALIKTRHQLTGNYPCQGVNSNSNPCSYGFQMYCQGENPMQQTAKSNKVTYIMGCINVPGSC